MVRPRRRLFDLLAIGLFASAIGLPMFGLFFRDPPKLDENRTRAGLPELPAKKYQFEAFAPRFELYLGDHLGYRDVLLGWHRQVTYGILGEPVTNQAWIGKDGWLYLNQSDPFGGNPKKPTPAERVEKWIDAYEARHHWLKSKGIDYIVVFAPDKAAVYPEYLKGYPARHPPLEMATPAAKILNERGVPCVNLLPALLEEKKSNPNLLYYKTDSHWNYDGARVGYRAIAAAVRERFPKFQIAPESSYAIRAESVVAGDTLRLAGFVEDAEPETIRKWTPLTAMTNRVALHNFRTPEEKATWSGVDDRIFEQPLATGPTLLFLHDSFGGHLFGFLGSDFSRVMALVTYGLPQEAVRVEQPQLVIQVIVARQLYSLSPPSSLK